MDTKAQKQQGRSKNHLSARIDPELRQAMSDWADVRKLPLSWVVGRVIETGWPIFQKHGIERRTA